MTNNKTKLELTWIGPLWFVNHVEAVSTVERGRKKLNRIFTTVFAPFWNPLVRISSGQ